MMVLPVRYVPDVDAARRFYETLGLTATTTIRVPEGRRGGWAELSAQGQGSGIALHYATEERPDGIDLSFEASEPLEAVAERLEAAGYPLATAIVDQSYGRSFTVLDPGGLEVTVNEYDRSLYT